MTYCENRFSLNLREPVFTSLENALALNTAGEHGGKP
jgi:hypothetical protein